jgi:hypothetical protein
MSSQSQIDANRINAQKSTGPRTPEGKARSRRNGLLHGFTAKTCMLEDEDPEGLTDLVYEISDKYHPQDTDEDFCIERMAKARWRYNRIMPLEAAIFNIRLTVDQAPKEVVAALSQEGQRAWAYLRDANGGNALGELSATRPACSANTTAPARSSKNFRKLAPPDPRNHPSPTNYELHHPKPTTLRGTRRTGRRRLAMGISQPLTSRFSARIVAFSDF